MMPLPRLDTHAQSGFHGSSGATQTFLGNVVVLESHQLGDLHLPPVISQRVSINVFGISVGVSTTVYTILFLISILQAYFKTINYTRV